MENLPQTLPASWFRSLPLYRLEQRAVFLKSWFLLGPITRFDVVHEKVQYEIAGVSLYVQRQSTGDHDIKVFDGNGTELRSHLTPTGLMFSAISSTAPDFQSFFPDLEPLLETVDFSRLPYRKTLRYEGAFNWKTMVDGYQECLHCQYTHPSFSVQYPPASYRVTNHRNFSQHLANPAKYRPDDGLFLYFFPICTLSVYGGGMHSFRVCPTEKPGVTRMEFDYYHIDDGEAFDKYLAFTRQVSMEDYELCEKAQRNLEVGIYNTGILNPVKETGVAFYQQRVFRMVLDQYEQDRRAVVDSDRIEIPQHDPQMLVVDLVEAKEG